MTRGAIRLNQLISTFGPGSLIVDRYGTTLMVCGLDHWFQREPDAEGNRNPPAPEVEEFRFSEWRLERALNMDFFMRPPDYRRAEKSKTPGQDQTPNVFLMIPTLRFPSYFLCGQSTCSSMRKAEMYLGKRPTCEEDHKFGNMNQVRFLAICPNGHIDDFPWQKWLGCPKLAGGQECNGKLRLRESGAADLASVRIDCSVCGKSETLGKAMSHDTNEQGEIESQLSRGIRERMGNHEAGNCTGRCPWHGEKHYEQCTQDMVATLINATNVFYSKVKTSIFIPVQLETGGGLEEVVSMLKENATLVAGIKAFWNMGQKDTVNTIVQAEIDKRPVSFMSVEEAKNSSGEALEQFFADRPMAQDDAAVPEFPESRETAFRRIEFNVLRQKIVNEDLRTRPVNVPAGLQDYLGSMVLVERLRETRVFHGFDRFRSRPTLGTPAELGDQALRQLFAKPPDEGQRWLPGTVVFGEGIYLELDEVRLRAWQQEQRDWLEERLVQTRYAGLLSQLDLDMAPPAEVNLDWTSRFLLIHTLAHIIINQLVFECGYSTASLRERLYVSADHAAPMGGLLIYTSAGDSEGTLGGLVRLAEPDNIMDVIVRACERASWCSADPVCSEVTHPKDFNLAACQSCVLLPETSCETFNRALDRGMVVGTPEHPSTGYFSGLLEQRVSFQSDSA